MNVFKQLLIALKRLLRLADRMITLAKKGTLHDRRLASKVIKRNELLQKLFDDIAKRNAERVSGHTRILRLPPRKGDAASVVLWELVDAAIVAEVSDELVERSFS